MTRVWILVIYGYFTPMPIGEFTSQTKCEDAAHAIIALLEGAKRTFECEEFPQKRDD